MSGIEFTQTPVEMLKEAEAKVVEAIVLLDLSFKQHHPKPQLLHDLMHVRAGIQNRIKMWEGK